MEAYDAIKSLTPSIHYNTTNISAIKCYHLLKDLGVKNNKFMLTIYDTGLMNVNPFSENLTPEIQRRIHLEVQRNFFYFLRECVRINVSGGKTKFNFHRGNLAMSWLMNNNIDSYLELPRQNGKTTVVMIYFAWVYGYRSINSKSSLMSKDPESVKGNLSIIKTILENMPPYLQMLDPRRDRINKESFSSASTGNSIQTRAPAGNLEGATNKGRGSSEPLQNFDEMPFIRFIKEVTLNSAPAYAEAANFARLNNAPFCRVFTSTPGILGTPDGDFVFDEFLTQCVKFDEKLFYDQPSAESLQNVIYEESRNNVVYVKFNYKQLGRGEDYFQSQCRYLQNDRDAIEREVLLKWSRRSMDSPFTKDQLDRVQQSIKTPIGTIIIRNRYVLKFYRKPDFSKKYVISVDCSGMLNNDYSSLVVIDPQTFEPIATLRSNARDSYSNTATYGKAIADIAINIFKNALLVIEKNNMGIAIIDNILDQYPELTARMYSSDLEPSSKAKNSYSVGDTAANANVLRYEGTVISYGFQTNNIRRTQMFSELLGILIGELYDVINDNDIFMELNGIIRRNGRLDHRLGKHDDMLFSYLIGLWVLCYSKILTTKYDYYVGYVRSMSILDSPDENLTSKDFEEPSIIEKMGSMISNTFQQSSVFSNRQSTGFTPTVYGSGIVTPDNMNSRFENEFNPNTASLSEISDYIFSDDSSLLDNSNSYLEDQPEIDTETDVEDVYQHAQGLDKSSRDQYVRHQQDQMDAQIRAAKDSKSKNLERARNVKERKHLERILESNREEISSGDISSLVDSFFN